MPPGRGFSEILLEGLAPDGGLYLPERYPRIDAADARALARPVATPTLAFEILSLYIDDIPPDDLRALVRARPTRADVFGDAAHHAARAARATASSCRRCPTARRWPSRTWRCSCSATCSSTSWRAAARRSTSSARPPATPAARPNTRCAASAASQVFMLSPHGRMSPFQQAQMFSLQDANIHNIAIEGVFDDCQDIVKAVSNDLDVQAPPPHRHGQLDQLGAPAGAGRLLLRRLLAGHAGRRRAAAVADVSFAVPSGNFGNICAGHVARMMGLPIGRLVVATNENDVLDEFFRTGTYRVRARRRDARDVEPVDGHLEGVELRALRVRPAGPRPGARAAQLFEDGRRPRRRASR